MFGVLITSLGTLFTEVSNSIGKFEAMEGKEGIYSLIFLNSLFQAVIFIVLAVTGSEKFVFVLASLPTFSVRFLLELFQAYVGAKATITADRSTTSFLFVLTIPLLLIVDVALGYAFNIYYLIGMAILILVFISFFYNRNFSKKGSLYAAIAAVNAVLTISLYKYDITHFNSVVGEQLVLTVFFLIAFFFFAYFRTKENPFRLLSRPVCAVQSASDGIGAVLISFAYPFAPASVITAAKRSSSVLWAVLSGNHYFKEKHILLKFSIMVFLIASLVFLAM